MESKVEESKAAEGHPIPPTHAQFDPESNLKLSNMYYNSIRKAASRGTLHKPNNCGL